MTDGGFLDLQMVRIWVCAWIEENAGKDDKTKDDLWFMVSCYLLNEEI